MESLQDPLQDPLLDPRKELQLDPHKDPLLDPRKGLHQDPSSFQDALQLPRAQLHLMNDLNSHSLDKNYLEFHQLKTQIVQDCSPRPNL